MYKNILFDLDGTIIDTSEGIINSINYALNKLGLKTLEEDDIRNIIGPPLEEMFDILLGKDSEKIKKAVMFFREVYSIKGINEVVLYKDVRKIIENLYDENKKLGIVTSKPEKYAVQILKKINIDKYFKYISGLSLNGKKIKKEVRLKNLISENSLIKEETVFIGDRFEDIQAGKKNNIATIGVTYGYGTREELIKVGADYIVDDAKTIVNIIKGERK